MPIKHSLLSENQQVSYPRNIISNYFLNILNLMYSVKYSEERTKGSTVKSMFTNNRTDTVIEGALTGI